MRPSKLDKLLSVGQQLSNVAYNWAQEGRFTDEERKMLRELAAGWSKARSDFGAELRGAEELPFTSQNDALMAVKLVCDQAADHLRTLSERYRSSGKHIRARIAFTRRGLNQLVREHYTRTAK